MLAKSLFIGYVYVFLFVMRVMTLLGTLSFILSEFKSWLLWIYVKHCLSDESNPVPNSIFIFVKLLRKTICLEGKVVNRLDNKLKSI